MLDATIFQFVCVNLRFSKRVFSSLRVFELVVFLILLFTTHAHASELPPAVTTGDMVVKHWAFEEGEPLEIRGEWEVIWGELVAPKNFDAVYSGDYFSLPDRWNNAQTDKMQGAFGAATFRVRLDLPIYSKDVAYHMIAVHSAYQIFIDGELVVRNGTVSETVEGFVANNVSRQFIGKSGRSEIILQAANFTHAYGGPGHGLKLYDSQSLKQILDSLSVIYGLVVGVLFTIGLFHLILYFADRKDDNAAIQFWFSILCFIIVYRVQGIIPLVHEYFHDSMYWRNLRLPYASLYAAPAVYLLFFRAVFPAQFPRKTTLCVVAISLLGLLFTITQSEYAYTSTRNFAIWLNVFVIVYSLIFTVQAVRIKIRGAGVILLANLIFLITAVYDAIIYTDQSSGFDLTPFGILVLGLGYSYALFLGLHSRFFDARQNSVALKELNLDLEHQVEDRTHAFQAAAAKAENAASDKARFIAAASHDLRQPLHALSLFNSALMQKLASGEAAPLVERQEKAIANLGTLLQDTLDAARLESQNKPLSPTTIRTFDIRDKLIDNFADRALSKGVALSINAQPGNVVSDMVMLQRILSNLLDNAIKAATKSVKMTIEREHQNWMFRIQDDGFGISQDDMDRVFKSYVSLDSSKPDEIGGYGLGLYVVKEFSKSLGGRISVSSTVGEGSFFSLLLPPLLLEQPQNHSMDKIDLNYAQMRGLRVLAVDDDQQILDAVTALLESWGCIVHTTNNSKEALSLARVSDPQLLILDYHLQGISGLELKNQLDTIVSQELPTLIVTGATELSILDNIKNHGLLVLEKPVHPDQLATALIGLLKA